jgi:hypothetical protein
LDFLCKAALQVLCSVHFFADRLLFSLALKIDSPPLSPLGPTGSHRRGRGCAGARRDCVTSDVLRRLIGSHLVRHFATPEHRRRLLHFFTVLVARTRRAHLLTTTLGCDPRFMLVFSGRH